MFKSASFFRIAADFVMPPLEALEQALQSTQFIPCGATQAESLGWGCAARQQKQRSD